MPRPGWLKRQFASAEKELAAYPAWMKQEYEDSLNDAFDYLLRNSEFGLVDYALRGCPVEKMPTDALLVFLTATLPARSKLFYRAEFFKRCKSEIERRGENDPGLLDGLQ